MYYYVHLCLPMPTCALLWSAPRPTPRAPCPLLPTPTIHSPPAAVLPWFTHCPLLHHPINYAQTQWKLIIMHFSNLQFHKFVGINFWNERCCWLYAVFTRSCGYSPPCDNCCVESSQLFVWLLRFCSSCTSILLFLLLGSFHPVQCHCHSVTNATQDN